MIDRIIDFSVHNKFLIIAAAAAACVVGVWSIQNMPLDAIPDLSDTQVIIFSRWDRSPDIVEDQLTYPIVSAMLGTPRVQSVRGFSDFGYSYVYVIFEEGTDIYWARSRTLEYLSPVLSQLPEGARTELGPDATGLGWVYQYALMDESRSYNLAELRSVQDWYLRYHLKSVPGVAEVAAVGGFGNQYQVNLDPNRLQAYGILLGAVNSDYSQLADVANQERIREYDYGPGFGGAAELYLQRKNLPLVTARYRFSRINVSNGSIYNGTYEGYNVGLDSDHDVHQTNLKLEIPISRSLTVGADGSIFFRRSRYNVTVETPEFGPPRRQTITQRNPEARLFLAWTYNH